jgi:hypothetical protein
MTFRIVPRYVDHLWYPILVKFPGSGGHHIIEMQGKKVNEWNDMVKRQYEEDTKNYPRGWSI